MRDSEPDMGRAEYLTELSHERLAELLADAVADRLRGDKIPQEVKEHLVDGQQHMVRFYGTPLSYDLALRISVRKGRVIFEWIMNSMVVRYEEA